MAITLPVRPEPVEGLSFFSKERAGLRQSSARTGGYVARGQSRLRESRSLRRADSPSLFRDSHRPRRNGG